MDALRLAIVVPAYNEKTTISGVVKSVIPYGTVIVVDDGSQDDTANLAVSVGAIVVKHNTNYGYDEALNSGVKKAFQLENTVVITFDADGQHDALLIPSFLDKIKNGADVVVGVRNQRQRLSEHIFAWYTNLRFKIKDPLCGMKAFTKEVYEDLGHVDSFGSTGTELAIFAAKNSYSIDEILITIDVRKDAPRFGQNFTGDYKILRAMVLSFWKIKKNIS